MTSIKFTNQQLKTIGKMLSKSLSMEIKSAKVTANIRDNFMLMCKAVSPKTSVKAFYESFNAKEVKADKWVGKMEKEAKWHPGEGFFKDNDASTIANGASRGHKGDLGAAIKALVAAKNRNSHQSPEIVGKIDHAIEILQKRKKKEGK